MLFFVLLLLFLVVTFSLFSWLFSVALLLTALNAAHDFLFIALAMVEGVLSQQDDVLVCWLAEDVELVEEEEKWSLVIRWYPPLVQLLLDSLLVGVVCSEYFK